MNKTGVIVGRLNKETLRSLIVNYGGNDVEIRAALL